MFATITMDNGCILQPDKTGIYHIINAEDCPDKQLVKYLNCNGLAIQNATKKECQDDVQVQTPVQKTQSK